MTIHSKQSSSNETSLLYQVLWMLPKSSQEPTKPRQRYTWSEAVKPNRIAKSQPDWVGVLQASTQQRTSSILPGDTKVGWKWSSRDIQVGDLDSGERTVKSNRYRPRISCEGFPCIEREDCHSNPFGGLDAEFRSHMLLTLKSLYIAISLLLCPT